MYTNAKVVTVDDRSSVVQAFAVKDGHYLATGSDAQMRAYIGPAICGRCYEVPAAMQTDVVADVPETQSTTRRDTPVLDLKAGVAAQLRRAGVAHITVDPACTAEDPRYFSHRRDGVTGRFAGVAVVGS